MTYGIGVKSPVVVPLAVVHAPAVIPVISYIKDMFDRNSNYIASKKEEGVFLDDFDYDSVIFMFDDLFGENGLDSCLDVFYSHYSGDKGKVRK